MNKILLVDGNNLIFRTYYATAYSGVIMRNSKGFPTNALYGFINMMNKIIREEKPEYILVAFDKGKTFRHTAYTEYKAGRSDTPDELKQQFPVAKEVLNAMGIKYYEMDNYEADDIIGTLSSLAHKDETFDCEIVSSDKDLLQLIEDDVVVKVVKSNEYIIMDRDNFKKTYEIEPIRMIDLKALMGDASDNIPGVQGIGEKTAIKLLKEYDNIDNLYDHIDEIKGKLQEKLITDKDNCYKSRELATIVKDIKLEFGLKDCKYKGIDNVKFKGILEELEFKSLLRKYDLMGEVSSNEVKEIKSSELKTKDIKDFDSSKEFSFYIETRGEVYSKSEILGISLYDGKYSYFIDKEDILKYKDIFENKTNKITYDLKKAIVVLNNLGIKINNCSFDTLIAAYLCDFIVKDDIAVLAGNFDYNIDLYVDTFGSIKRPIEVSQDDLKKITGNKAKFIYEVKDELLERIKEYDEEDLFYNIEMKLVEVLASMEIEGIKVDKDYLEDVKQELEEKMSSVEKEIYEIAGHEFNIMSPAQLADVLFVELEIPYPKRVKNNKYSTSKDILDKISFVNPIVDKVLEYRMLSKLYSNYAVGLLSEIREDGRIHTTYTQTLTRTGRLSSISPNLQNIPARDEYGRLVRKAFVADEDSVLLSSDYSQVELRVFASMANAENMIEAFKEDKDIHTKTASDIYHVPMNEVTKAMRRTAKAVNFGIIYGISSFGLSEDLGINIGEAKEFIDKYLEAFPGISEYMREEKDEAYKNGYVTTLMNRRRVIDELKSSNYMIRQSGERMALNTPIQGTAADILKKAMVELYEELNKRKLKSKILLQVHDELVLNVKNDELDEVKVLVKDIMENTFKLQVPLKVEIETGTNWYEAK
ncbi:MAG: DNA polymerase I [Bacilli bacterium]|nr:DNA polymerase I [Bacilli bacterium]